MPPTSSPTKSGPPKLSEQAKHLKAPEGIVSTAWPAVQRTCVDKLGITFDPWQESAGRLILAKRADGNLAAMVDGVGLSLPRQVGKTYLIGSMVFALCVNMPGLLVIWSAHHARTHGETFLAMQGFAERARVAPHVRQVFTGSGDEEIRFHNGSRILFGARERGFGRGIPGVDVLIFDEAQILSDKALSNMLATMNTSRFGLQLYIGTPPKPEDMSESFQRMRASALDGSLTEGAWIEFGAEDKADGEDRAQWRKANPSYPRRTPVQSLLRLKRKLTDDDWRREGLGIWDERPGVVALIRNDVWKAGHREIAPPAGVQAYGVKFSPDGQRVSLAGARRPEDGPTHVEVIKSMSTASGTADLADWIAARWRKAAVIVVDGKAGADQFVTALVKRGVPRRRIVVPTLSQVYEAHSGLLESVKSGVLTHYGQTGLDDVVRAATKRPIGKDGGWGWQAISDDVDVTPLEAVTYAHFGATTTKRKPSGDGERASSSGRRAVVA